MSTATVAHRLSFPLTRRFTHRAMLTGALVANALSSRYIQSHVPAEDEVDEYVGMYL